MPSFLNKVFGLKKNDDKEASRPSREPSDNTLLDGKYEAISPVVSPSAITFAEAQSSKDAEREASFSIFRPKPRGTPQKSTHRRQDPVPHLTLHLPGPKESLDSRAFGVAFEADPDTQLLLDDAVIGAKHLSPLEALILIRACAQTITERGIETLGIMHPHWFSASPDVQRKLISLFIHSLTPQSRITTLSPTPTSSATAFENELHYTHSPHDVAAVLRWGLRHLSLENGFFGKDSADWAWYNAFFNAEHDASYPLRGFSQLLLPQLPAHHSELLVTTLTLISSLASHAEANSISGSKLSKFLGIWLLASTRSEPSDNWDRFYARWERAGRILEHLFLARLRDESLAQRLPTRLQELIKYYPYNKGSPVTEQDLLPRPRFSTVQFDALFVRVESLLTHGAAQPKQHPIQLIIDALQLPTSNLSGSDHLELWNAIKTAAFESDSEPSAPEGAQFTRIFADETVQLLSIIPADGSVPTSPILLTSPILSPKRSSSSLAKIIQNAVSKSRKSNGSAAVSPTSPVTPMVTDWAQFSLSGFGETPVTQPLSALLDQDDDVEVTQPQVSRQPSRKRGTSRTRRRRSEDNDISATPSTQQLVESEPIIVETKLASVHIIQIDEAFIDFWSDAIVDPISADWPTFAVCALKVIPNSEKPVRWLVIEQMYTHEEPAPPPRVPSPEAGARGRSPRPSFRSDISGFRIGSMFASTRKRFSVFNKSATELSPRKSAGKSPKVGELGQILVEEPSTPRMAQGSKNLELATPAVTDGAMSAELTPVAAAVELSSSTANGSGPEIAQPKEDLANERPEEPSTEPAPQSASRDHGLWPHEQSINMPSEQVEVVPATIEVTSQSAPALASVPVDVVDGSLVIVASSPSTSAETETTEKSTMFKEMTVTQAQAVPVAVPKTVETAIGAAEVPPPVVELEDKAPPEPEPVVEASRGRVEEQSAVDVIPVVAAAEEISESIVLVETPTPEVVVEASESVVPAAAEPERVGENVEAPVLEELVVVPESAETPAVEAAVTHLEDDVVVEDLPAVEEAVVVETEAQPALGASASDAVQAPQEIEVATPSPEFADAFVQETPGQEACDDVAQPEPEAVAAVEEATAAPEQLEETPVLAVDEPQVVVVVEEEQPSQDVVAQPAEEPVIEIVAVEPVLNETTEVQAPLVETPAVESASPEVASATVVDPEPAADEVPEPVVDEVQTSVEEEESRDVVAQPAEEPSVPEPSAADDVIPVDAPAAQEVVEEAVVTESAPENSIPEPVALVEETEVVVEDSQPAEAAPAVVAEAEPVVEEAPESAMEEAQVVPAPAEEPAIAEVPLVQPAPEEVLVEVVAVEEVAEAVAEAPAEEAVEEVIDPEPAIDVVEPEPVEEEAVTEHPVPAVADIEASEPVFAEPAEDNEPEPTAEKVAAEEVVASEPIVLAEPEPAEEKAPEPIVEEEPAPIAVEEAASPEVPVGASEPVVADEPQPSEEGAPEPLADAVEVEEAVSESVAVAEAESVEGKTPEPFVEDEEPPAEIVLLVQDNGEDAPIPAAEQEVETKVVAEYQEVVQEPEPTPPVVESTVLVEEETAPGTAPETATETIECPVPEAAAEVEVTPEAQGSSEEPIAAIPSQEPQSMMVPEETPIEQPVKVAEEPVVEAVSEQVEVQVEEPEAVPFVEDDDVEDLLVEDSEPTEPSVPEVVVPTPEPDVTVHDATPEDA